MVVNRRSLTFRRLRLAIFAAIWSGMLFCPCTTRGQESQGSMGESEADLEHSIATLRKQSEDPTYELPQRESIAIELAAMLDRAAITAKDPESQRKWWNQAIKVLDEFGQKNPEHPRSRPFQLQAAIYRWASARSSQHQWELNPSQTKLREESISGLDNAIARMRKLSMAPADDKEDSYRRNLKFRLAQALADRAEFEQSPEGRAPFDAEARTLVDAALAESSIEGYARLLKGELLRREGKFDAALAEVEAAAKAMPPPQERQIITVRSQVLTAQGRYDDALRAIKESHLEPAARHLLSVQALLAKRSKLAPDADRHPVDSQLFEELTPLRNLPGPDVRTALLALSRAKIEPDPRLGAIAWDILADAYEAAGDSIKASALEERAAVRAEDSRHPDQAIGYRLKAGALLFRAGRFLEADAVLSRITKQQTPEYASLQAKANLLRAMSLGRAVALKLPGASASTYKGLLESQIKEFPKDPGTDEARWLLGDLVLAEGQRDRASALWSAIGVKSKRWLQARRAVAAFELATLAEGDFTADPAKARSIFHRATEFLDRSIQEAPNEAASTELLLDLAMINLAPEIHNADDAREIADRVGRSSITNAQRSRADLVRMIALAQLGRYVEAELIARRLSEAEDALDTGTLLEAVRILDRSATTSDTDLRQRRFGLLLRMLLVPIFAHDTSRWPPEQLAELHMRLTRGLVFLGDERAAKGSLASWKGQAAIKQWNDSLLRDLADTYARLNAPELAIDVHRLRFRNLTAGSVPWLDAKYGLALALYRSGRSREALNLIDATAILHPELGGSPLKEKFIRLRQRLGNAP